ncbi:MAG: putative DNA binding domain-containing protein [Candidatus Aenigmarchaeota archaeon]|nr:putative DNA binding domain-containing protein [Candidatus Aenigmarchaeota archaeon]
MNFETLLTQKENDDLDFKEILPTPKKVAQLVTSFYNSRGGKIIIGVDDNKQPIGINNPQKTEHRFIQIIRHWCRLDKEPEIEFIRYKDKDFIVIDCPKGKDTPYFVKGEHSPRVRIGSSNMPANKEETARLYREGASKSQDIYHVDGATLNDLNLDMIKSYFKESRLTEQLDEKYFFKLMEKEHFVVIEKDEIIPTIAGILLFGKYPQINIPCALIKADRYRGTDMVQWIDKNNFEGNIFELIEKCEYFFKKNMRISSWSSGFKTEHKFEYPVEALKEAVINSLVHRDYHQYGKNILIRMFDDRIEIISPGELLRPLTIEKLQLHDYKPNSRNKVIAKVLLRKGIMDERGSGILRMEDAMIGWGLEKPIYADEEAYFVIKFNGPGRVEKPLEKAILNGLNERQIKALGYITEYNKINRDNYCKINDVKKSIAYEELKFMVNINIIMPIGKGKATYYVLSGRLPDDYRTIRKEDYKQ